MAFARFARDLRNNHKSSSCIQFMHPVRQGFVLFSKTLASRVNAIDPYDIYHHFNTPTIVNILHVQIDSFIGITLFDRHDRQHSFNKFAEL